MSEQPQNIFNQVDQQVASDMPATVLVERSNGDITPAQVTGVAEGTTDAFFADISEGIKDDMLFKPVPNEKLTDKYQEHLAEQLASKALQGSGVELNVSSVSKEAPVDKYTDEFIKENPYAHLLDKELSDEQIEAVAKRIDSIDTRNDEQKQAAAEQAAGEAMQKQRAAADHRYDVARQAGADDEAASASADRAYKKTYAELLTEELNKLK